MLLIGQRNGLTWGCKEEGKVFRFGLTVPLNRIMRRRRNRKKENKREKRKGENEL